MTIEVIIPRLRLRAFRAEESGVVQSLNKIWFNLPPKAKKKDHLEPLSTARLMRALLFRTDDKPSTIFSASHCLWSACQRGASMCWVRLRSHHRTFWKLIRSRQVAYRPGLCRDGCYPFVRRLKILLIMYAPTGGKGILVNGFFREWMVRFSLWVMMGEIIYQQVK